MYWSPFCLVLAVFAATTLLGCGGAMSTRTRASTGGGESEAPAQSEDFSAGGEGESDAAPQASPAVNDTWAQLMADDQQLDDALEMGRTDCVQIRQLGETICALADRVCEIAESEDDMGTAERCTDGEQRCEHARDRIENRCP